MVVVSLVGFRSTCRLPQLLHMMVKRTINMAAGPHSAAPQPALSETRLSSLITLLCLTRGCENEHGSIERSQHVPDCIPMLSARVLGIAVAHLDVMDTHLSSGTMLLAMPGTLSPEISHEPRTLQPKYSREWTLEAMASFILAP